MTDCGRRLWVTIYVAVVLPPPGIRALDETEPLESQVTTAFSSYRATELLPNPVG